MKASTHSIVGTGLFALDVILRQDGSQPPPTLGGSAGNVLCILGALGWDVTPVGVLGQDVAADWVGRGFEEVQADTRFLLRSEGRMTPVIYQHQLPPSHDGSTHRFSFECPVCGQLRRPFWDRDDQLEVFHSELPAASVFFLDRPTKLGVTLAEQYSASGTLVVFEPSTVGHDPELFERAVRCADVVKYAEDRIHRLDEFSIRDSALEIQTLGPEGLRFRVAAVSDEWNYLNAYHVPFLQDTSGAGDWCTSGLLFDLFAQSECRRSKLLDYQFLTSALAFGQALSTLNCMTEGARGLLSTWPADSVIQLARELQVARLSAVHLGKSDARERVSEPRLFRLISEANRGGNTSSSRHPDYCCPTF